MKPLRLYRACVLFLPLLAAFAPMNLLGAANYVYHERTTANPGCGGQYVSVLNPSSAQSYTLRFKVEYQFDTDRVRVYYTTNGSTPSGAFGVGNVGTFVVAASYVCTFGGPVVDVAEAVIPAQPAGTVVKYIVSAWKDLSGDEIFANSGTCGGCGNFNNSSLATVFQYTVGLLWDSDANAANNNPVTGGGLGGTGSWNDLISFNWFDGVADVQWSNAAYAGNLDVTFDGTAGTVTLGSGRSVRSINFKVPGYLVTNSTVTLSSTGPINTVSGVSTLGSLLAGTAGYTKSGAGTLILPNSGNTITGPVLINQGVLELTGSGRIGGTGAGAGNVTINGGTLRNTDPAVGGTFLTANRSIIVGAGGGAIDVATSGAVLIYTSGSITGVGNTLTKAGAGTFRNTTPTSITFTKLIVTGGLYQAAADNIFGAVPGAYLADAITLNGGGISVNAGVTFSANRGITLGALGGSIDGSSSPVVPGKITGVGSLTKTGTGILTLSGANDFSGGLNQNGGRINYNHSNAAGTGTITVGASATEFVSTATGIVLTNPIVLSSGANPKYYATSGNDLDQTGPMSGAGALTRDDNGSGNVTLSGSNTFSGGVAWTSRSLRLNNKQALGTGLFGIGGGSAPPTPPLSLTAVSALTGANALTNAVAINQDFTLAAVNSAQFNGPITMAASRTITVNNGVALVLAGDFSSSASVLNKYGLGTLELAGSNSFSGGVTVTNGTLRVNNTVGTGTGSGAVLVTHNATLGGTGFISGTVSIASAATLAPGNSIGTLTLGSSPVLGGTLAAEINKTGLTLAADKLVVSGQPLAYAGTLTVTASGDALVGAEVFDLFDASAFSGAFAATNLPALGAGLNWWLGALTTDGSIAVNRAPIANATNISRPPGLSAKIKIADLLAAATSDLDGDARSLQSLGTPTNGTGVATSDATHIFYDNPNALNDTFTYTIQDTRGGVTTGTITVNVTAPPSGSALSVDTSGGSATVKFQGIPGYHYDIERSEDLMTWITVASDLVAGPTGAFQVTDNSPPPVSAFYRSRQH